MRPAPEVAASLPLAAAALAALAAAASGLDQSWRLPQEIDLRFYGFFLDRYPLFVFVIVYGLARIAMMAASGVASLPRRAIGGLIGIVLLLAVSLHPTFGGIVLRAGFATGGMTFLTYQPMSAAYLIGAAASAFVFGSVLAASRVLIGPARSRMTWGWRLRRGSLRTVARYVSLWFAFAVIGHAHAVGFGAWPRRAMTMSDGGIASALVLIGLLPHAVLVWLALRRDSRVASIVA